VPPHGVCAPVPPAHGNSGILLVSGALLVAELLSIAPLHPMAVSASTQPICFNIGHSSYAGPLRPVGARQKQAVRHPRRHHRIHWT
jgi:hypothetical protein